MSDDPRQILLEEIGKIAPEVESTGVDPNADLRFGPISDNIFRLFKRREGYDAGQGRTQSGQIGRK